MSPGADHLARALAATRAQDADAHAVRAIHADPDLAVAYALRGRVAALRGDCVAAAHYYRVAFDRGDHGAETRAALAVCVAAAGDQRGARTVRGDATLPAMLEPFGELVSMQGPMVRGVLQARLPGRGLPAFLPGDPAARQASNPPRAAVEDVSAGHAARGHRQGVSPERRTRAESVTPVAGVRAAGRPPRQRTVSLGTIEADSAPPPPATSASYARAPAPAPRPSAQPAAESWLEESHTRRTTRVPVAQGDWLDDDFFSDISGGRVAVEPVELAIDPGVLEVEALSPVTGRRIAASEHARRDGLMPDFETPPVAPVPPRSTSLPPRSASLPPHAARPSRSPSLPPRARPAPNEPDLFEARAPLTAAGIGGLRLALDLPGPVITATGEKPQKLGKQMALGLTAGEMVLCDPAINRGPVRLPFSQLQRMDVLRAGQQVSLALSDGRQLHLDLRSLEARAPTVLRVLIAELAASLRAVGAQVNI